jgi:hypothetical protein
MGYDVSTTLVYGMQVEEPEDEEDIWDLEENIMESTGGVYSFVKFDDSAWDSPRGCFIVVRDLVRHISHGNSIEEDNYFFKCQDPDLPHQVILNIFDVAKEWELKLLDDKPHWVIGCHGG